MNWLALLGSVLGAGGISAFITALVSRRKSNAEAAATNIRSILEVDARLNERLAKIEERVAALERENFELKQIKLTLTYENEKCLEEIEGLKEENASLIEENEMLKERNYELEEELEYLRA